MTISRLSLALSAALLAGATFVGVSAAQENIGTVSQPLVGGRLVDVAEQERMGLLSMPGCSASLLRNEWAITAAHCVDGAADTSLTLTAQWGGMQTRQSLRIVSFRPLDVAIIRLSAPFTVDGSVRRFNREGFQGRPAASMRLTAYGRGINTFAFRNAAGADVPSARDGLYRGANFIVSGADDNQVAYRAGVGSIAGGDSGGPSFAPDGRLVGVHAICDVECVPGRMCGDQASAPPGYSPWQWVTATPQCADAPVAPIWDDINRYLGAFVPEPERGEGFIGTFGTTPANYQPMWVYAIKDDGDLLWYRKDSGSVPWQGPKKVGNGWGGFKDVIPAGGNGLYALGADGSLKWYRHDGFNGGSFQWKGPVDVGRGWNFSRIFAGGEGVVYAIKDDGTLVWYRHNGFADGGGIDTWSGPRTVGNGWNNFRDVFSEGKGVIYAIQSDGALLRYEHNGHASGDATWGGPRTIGSGWQQFRQVVPAGDGVLLAIRPDGRMLGYKYSGRIPGSLFGAGDRLAVRVSDAWEGPVEIGSGWQGFRKVLALLPYDAPGPR